MDGRYAKSLAVVQPKSAKSGSAQPRRLLEHRLEDRREVTRRGIDDLQHLGSRSLSLQRFLLLGQEPRVLDGDDRLVGEVLEQLNLFGAERSHFGAVDKDGANQCAILQHRDANGRSCSPEPRGDADYRLGSVVRAMAQLLRSYDTIKMAAGRRPEP
jgi:hypothetical protein